MTLSESSSSDGGFAELRQRAESMLEDSTHLRDPDMTRAEMMREMQLQRIELELQRQELQRCQEQLDDSQERYSDLYFNAPVGYVTLDREASIGELNYLAAELLGSNRKSLRETSLYDHIRSNSHGELEHHLQEVFSGAGVHQAELAVDLPTDTTVYLKVVSIAVEDPQSGNLQCRSAIFDVTEQRRAREQQEQLEKKLRQSHRMETLGRLASGIAHDFNNLLTLIIGYSKLAINTLPDGDPLETHVREINKAGHHASELIEQLLAFSRSDGTSAAPVNVNELIAEMETMFDRLVGDDIELHLHLHEQLGVVNFDSSQFQQVLLNLVVNARDAMGDGGNIYVRTRHVDFGDEEAGELELDPGCHILIEVEDEGDGIPPEVIPHIFEPFFTTKATCENHGFGLSTTYGIVARHDGTIDVDSAPGGGTSFRVYLPRTDHTDSAGEQAATRPTVLIVDDQPDLRDFASLVLQDMEADVINASTPQDALQMSRTYGDELSLVVTDVTMPGMSGPQLLDRIRESHPSARVLYISGYDRDSLCIDRDLAPDAPFLEKPFSPDALREMVQSLLADEM